VIKYGESSLGLRKVYERVERFRRGQTNSNDAHPDRTLITHIICAEVKGQINLLSRDNRRIIMLKTAFEQNNHHVRKR
jgi:hypothetical protein